MTIRYADSFGAYAAMSDLQKAGYSSTGLGSFSLQSTASRRAGKALRASFSASAAYLQRTVPGDATATVAVAVAARISDISQALDTTGLMLVFRDDTVVHVGISVLTDGSVRAYRGTGGGATTLGTSSTGLITSNNYFHLEVEVLVHNSAGTVRVFLNGNPTPILDLSGQDTQNGGTAFVTAVGTGSDRLASVNFDFCDLVVRDGTTQLGDVRVDYRAANGNGDTNSFATNGSATASENVDETSPNDLDYNYSSSPGATDLYNLQDIDWSPSSILAVVEKVRAKKSDAGTRGLTHAALSNSNSFTGDTSAVGTDPAYYHNVREVDPDTTAAWAEAAVNALQVGAVVV